MRDRAEWDKETGALASILKEGPSPSLEETICLSIFPPNIICITRKHRVDYLAHSELRRRVSSNAPSTDQLAAGLD